MEQGQLSREDIKREQTKEDGLRIIPYEEKCLKGASYDVSPTIIAMSVKIGMLETVYRDKTYPENYYIFVRANDTVLVISKDFLSLPLNMAGYVVSRVSKVSDGFGHVSTSIDPGWKGALLIALSNPTNKPIKVYVGGKHKKPLATISLHYLNTKCEQSYLERSGMRLDLLDKNKYSRRQGIRASIRKIIHPNRKAYTDFFFRFCDNTALDEENWKNAVIELQGQIIDAQCITCKYYVGNDKKQKSHFADYIVTENTFLQIIHLLQKHLPTIQYIIAIIITILVLVGAIPNDLKNEIKDFINTLNAFK